MYLERSSRVGASEMKRKSCAKIVINIAERVA